MCFLLNNQIKELMDKKKEVILVHPNGASPVPSDCEIFQYDV